MQALGVGGDDGEDDGEDASSLMSLDDEQTSGDSVAPTAGPVSAVVVQQATVAPFDTGSAVATSVNTTNAVPKVQAKIRHTTPISNGLKSNPFKDERLGETSSIRFACADAFAVVLTRNGSPREAYEDQRKRTKRVNPLFQAVVQKVCAPQHPFDSSTDWATG